MHASLDDAFTKAFREPCVVFADHPSLRFGDAAYFMEVRCARHGSRLCAPRFWPGAVRCPPPWLAARAWLPLFLTALWCTLAAQRWAGSERNTLIAIEPEFANLDDLLAPYQPVRMKAVSLPIDARLNFAEVSRECCALALPRGRGTRASAGVSPPRWHPVVCVRTDFDHQANAMLADLSPGVVVTSPYHTTPTTRLGPDHYGGTTPDGHADNM